MGEITTTESERESATADERACDGRMGDITADDCTADDYTVGPEHTAYFDGARCIHLDAFGIGAYLDWADKRGPTHQAEALAPPQACASHEAEEAHATPPAHTRSHAADEAHAATGDAAHPGTTSAARSNAGRRAWRAAWAWSSARRARVAAGTDANGPWPTRRTAGPADFFAAAHARRASAWRNTGRSATARSRTRSVTTPDRDT